MDNEDSNQTALLRSLIRVFVGRKRQKVRFLTFRPIFCIEKETEILDVQKTRIVLRTCKKVR